MLRDDPSRIGPEGRDTIALHLAVSKRNLVTIRWLLAHGVDVNAKRSVWDCNSTALHMTIESGASVRDVVLVLDRGLSIDGRITMPDGGAMPIVYVSVDAEGEGRSADCEASADGRFVANGLSEGA